MPTNAQLFLEERKKERRIRVVVFIVGLFLGIVFHVYLFLVPTFDYKASSIKTAKPQIVKITPYRILRQPKLEQKRTIERKLQKHAHKTQNVQTKRTVTKRQSFSQHNISRQPAKQHSSKPQTAPKLPKKSPVPKEVVAKPAPPPKPDSASWQQMLAKLEQKQQKREQLIRTLAKPVQAQPDQETESPGEQFLEDTRVRISVASYPTTSIEHDFPFIPYPDAKIAKKDLKKGICRVYYRVWVDETGSIVRHKLKYPTDKRELQEYSLFVEHTWENISSWEFPPVKAEVHIDVFYEIE